MKHRIHIARYLPVLYVQLGDPDQRGVRDHESFTLSVERDEWDVVERRRALVKEIAPDLGLDTRLGRVRLRPVKLPCAGGQHAYLLNRLRRERAVFNIHVLKDSDLCQNLSAILYGRAPA